MSYAYGKKDYIDCCFGLHKFLGIFAGAADSFEQRLSHGG